MKVLVIGCGPTALGAACQAQEYAKAGANIELIVVERESEPGGLSRTVIDPQGYQWDYGGHVTFSHFDYYNRTLTASVPNWKTHQRICAIDMAHLNGGKLMLLPYPIQKSVVRFPEDVKRRCALDLRKLYDAQQANNNVVINGYHSDDQSNMRHFDDFCRQKFGDTLTEVFFKPYNEKIWRTPTTGMSAEWIGARVAPIDEKDLDRLENPEKYINEPAVDHGWGPNATFRYPITGGTGYIWKCVHSTLPQHWFRLGQSVTKVDVDEKTAIIKTATGDEEVRYDKLISTVPLDILGEICGYPKTAALRHTSVVITGIGVKRPLPDFLEGKSWMYFPDDSPFYRVSVLSNYFPTSTPNPDEYTLLIEQSMEPEHTEGLDLKALQASTLEKLAHKGFLDQKRTNHIYSFVMPYGYPIPTLDRTPILKESQAWLEQHDIFSRGRFGGWKYECSNQDYSFMQGAEAVARIVENKKETVYTL